MHKTHTLQTFLQTFFVLVMILLPLVSVPSVNAVGDYGAADGCGIPDSEFSAVTGSQNDALFIVDSRARDNFPACTTIETDDLGFRIPSLGDILTFAIRAFFVIAGLAALFYLLLGAFGWVTSGGDKDSITAARDKIQAAILGMILIVAVLAIIWTLEQVIFKRRICLGLSCPLTLPGLIERTDGDYCCVCVKRDTNGLGQVVNTSNFKCNDAGNAIPL